jgi:glycosyltransferase involved in cell wall biosynthesis
MKVVCYAQRLEIGGTQVNAIDLAAGLRDRFGWDVLFFATPGPMEGLVAARGLRYVAAPDAYVHPSLPRMKSLRDLVREERPDVVHAWDWWQGLDAFYGVHLPWGIPLVITDMMPDLARVLPKNVPTTFGTPELAEVASAAGRKNVRVLLPPVDVLSNAPGIVDAEPFRRRFGVDDRFRNVVIVSRLGVWLKSESLFRSIDAMRLAGSDSGLRLIIVGDGEARPGLEALASEVNRSLGRTAVILTGALVDPRPAYAAADVVVGMGSSALRALAFAKPVIVVGGAGFSELFRPTTAARFLHGGMYGVGDGEAGGQRLAQQLLSLSGDHDRLATLGQFGRRFVEQHFALEAVCGQLHETLTAAVAAETSRVGRVLEAARTSAVYLRERRFLCPSRDRRPIDAVTDSGTTIA